MEQMDAIMLIAFSLLAVLSLLIVVLQKKE